MVLVQHICPPAARSSHRCGDYIMKWGRANEMGKNIPPLSLPPPTPGALHHLPSAKILLNHRDIHPACLSLCFGLSVRKHALSTLLFFFSCLPVCLPAVFKTLLCLSLPYLPSSVCQSLLKFFSAALIVCLWNQLSPLQLSFLLSLWIWCNEQHR